MTNSIEKRIELKAPVSTVWRALTDHRAFGEWFRVKLDGPFAQGEVSHGHITYPVGFGVDAIEVATRTGCFFEANDRFLQKSGFVLRPGGEIARASYSSGPTGALTTADTIYSLDFFQKNPAHRSGILRRPAAVAAQ